MRDPNPARGLRALEAASLSDGADMRALTRPAELFTAMEPAGEPVLNTSSGTSLPG